MWPFDLLRQRKYQREYKAALVVLLGAYGSPQLTPEQRARVESDMDRNWNLTEFPAVSNRRTSSWDFIAAERAAAMDRLGIPPAVAGLSWRDLFASLPNPKWIFQMAPYAMRNFDPRGGFITMQFRPMSEATADAKKFLRKRGLDVPEADPWKVSDLLPAERIREVTK